MIPAEWRGVYHILIVLCQEGRDRGNGVRFPCCLATVMETKAEFLIMPLFAREREGRQVGGPKPGDRPSLLKPRMKELS